MRSWSLFSTSLNLNQKLSSYICCFKILIMKVSCKSYVYYALCELGDALENIEHLRLIFKDDDLLSSLLDSVVSDVESAYTKLENISL